MVSGFEFRPSNLLAKQWQSQKILLVAVRGATRIANPRVALVLLPCMMDFRPSVCCCLFSRLWAAWQYEAKFNGYCCLAGRDVSGEALKMRHGFAGFLEGRFGGAGALEEKFVLGWSAHDCAR